MFADLGTDILVQTITLAYPVGDLVILFCIIVLVLRQPQATLASTLLIASLVALAVGDSAYLVLAADDRYRTGNPIDLLWIGGMVALALGAVYDTRCRTGLRRHPMSDIPGASLSLGFSWRPPGPCHGSWPLVAQDQRPPFDQALSSAAVLLIVLRCVAGYRHTAFAYQVESARHREAREASIHDALTGVANRRGFEDRLEELLLEAGKSQRPFGLIYVDADNFKRFNDTYGHAAGDDALRALAMTLVRQSGANDLVARIGGDEFALLMTGADANTLAARVDTLQRTIDATCPVRGSVGGQCGSPEIRCARDILEAADDALYAAKDIRHAALGLVKASS
jgi:diguanylate cyclase (GGDEF)-like protein